MKNLKLVFLLVIVLICRFFWCLEVGFFSDFLVFSEAFSVDSLRVFLIFLSVLVFFLLFNFYKFYMRLSLCFAIFSFCASKVLFFFMWG